MAAALEAEDEAVSDKKCRKFPVDALPKVLRRFVQEAAAAIGCDPSYVALPLLACLARAIGLKRAIQLKRTWMEFPIIWAAIVGKSGTHKSPAIQLATAVLARKQADALAKHTEAMAQYDQDFANYERDLALWKRGKSKDLPPWPPSVPVCERYITTDCTIEALQDRLESQPDGILMVRDELAGWVDGQAEYKGGKGSDTGHWLAMWSGLPLTVDRKSGKKLMHIPRAAVSIVGGIQPGVLRRAIGREHMQDGLCARLLLAMPEVRPIVWTEATVSPATEAALAEVFDKLLSLEPAADPDGNPAPYPVPLTPEAKATWVASYNRRRAEQVGLDDDLAAAWSKLEAYAARFALIFQMVSWASGESSAEAVDQVNLERGVALADWFAEEARRVYAVLTEDVEQQERRELVELIERTGRHITPRNLMRASRRYPSADDAEAALNGLVKAEIGAWQAVPTGDRGGRPHRVFILADGADTTISNDEEEVGSVSVNSLDKQREDDIEAANRLLVELAEEGRQSSESPG